MGKIDFAMKLKKARYLAGFTQKDIYERLGISQSTFSSWETGRGQPDADTLIKLCQYYGITSFSYFNDSITSPSLTPEGQRIGRAYDRATPPVQRTVEVALEPYMDAKPVQTSKNPPEAPADGDRQPRTLPLHLLPASAGRGVFLDDNSFTLVEVDDTVPLSANFGVRISGDSMEPDYPGGCIAWVKRTAAVDVGQVGVFAVNDEGYIKRLGRRGLISINPKYPDIRLGEDDEMRTYGLVVGVTANVY